MRPVQSFLMLDVVLALVRWLLSAFRNHRNLPLGMPMEHHQLMAQSDVLEHQVSVVSERR